MTAHWGRESLVTERPRLSSAIKIIPVQVQAPRTAAPFSRQIAEPLYADAAGQATFYGCFDKIGGKEGERDRHVNLPDAAFLARAKFGDVGSDFVLWHI
jgi:hypothetical protein